MKVRIRFCKGLSQGPPQPLVTLNVTASTNNSETPEHITLSDLKKAVYEYTVLQTGCPTKDDGWKQVVVSLDGSHPLEARCGRQGCHDTRESICEHDAITSLQNLGLVVGDTIYVMEIPLDIRPSGSPAGEKQEDPHPSNRDGESEETYHRSMVPCILYKLDQSLKERGLDHLLTRNDALALIIHGGLIDYGFDCCHDIDSIVGNTCKKNACIYEITYVLRLENISEHLEMLLYLSMQRKTVMLVMQFPCGSLVTKSLEIPGRVCTDQLYDTSRNKHSVWSRTLYWTEEHCFHMLTLCKDAFCRHVLLMACTKMNVEYPGACLSMMPVDVKMTILGFLAFDDLCRLGMTCQDFCTLHRDNTLWFALLAKHFKKDAVIELDVYGKYAAKQEFKRLMLAQREELSRRHSSIHLGLRWTPPPAPAWGQQRPRLSGITGGDYDRLPPGFPQRRTSRHSQWRLD